jgi:hypothetical protein
MRILVCGAVLLVFAAGCKKTEPVAPVAVKASAPVAAPVAAAPAAAAPNPANAVPLIVADGVTYTATTGDGKDVVWALRQDEIKHDPDGQWASDASASSSWNDAKEKVRYAPWQATGEPNVDQVSDNPNAWTAKSSDGGMEWLELTYPKAVQATGVRIRESENAGAVVKVELYDEAGLAHPMWQGPDPTRGLNYLELTFPKTTFKTNKVRVILATNIVPGDNEIDAVQLLGK